MTRPVDWLALVASRIFGESRSAVRRRCDRELPLRRTQLETWPDSHGIAVIFQKWNGMRARRDGRETFETAGRWAPRAWQ